MWRSPLNIVFKGGHRMTKFSNHLKELLHSLITEMAENRQEYTVNPKSDFTRNGKRKFIEYTEYLCSKAGGTTSKEILEFYNYQSTDSVTPSAICQARQKINYQAFEHLFHAFNNAAPSSNKLFKGYLLYAVDGSIMPIYRNPKEPSGTFENSKLNTRGSNSLHLNATYDILNRVFVHATFQPQTKRNEKAAFAQMVDSIQTHKRIIYIADRGYESYNNFAHVIENHQFFLIRVKDIHSNGIASRLGLPKKDCFDVLTSRIITRKRRKHFRASPDKYKIIGSTSPLDYLDDDHPTYTMSFRFVRVRLDNGEYELLCTNLPKKKFKPSDLKELYYLRWGIETSFRELKYTVGAMNLNSKKVDLIKQELFISLLTYNFTSMIINKTPVPKGKKKDKKYSYHINFSVAVTVCRRLIRSLAFVTPPDDVEAIISQNLEANRYNRIFARYPSNRRRWVSFNYRVA